MRPYRLIWKNRLGISKFLTKLNQKSSNIYNSNKFWSEITNSVSIPKNLSHTLVWLLLPRIIKKLNKMPKTNYLMTPQSGLRIRNKMREYELINKDMSLSELKKEVVKDSKERIIGKADLEILIAISALKEFKKWDSCIQLLREHRIPLTHVNLRHYFFSQQIIEALQIHKKPNLRVLEIGGGGGNLKTILKIQLNNLIQNYFIIDLPEMIAISAYSTSRFFKFEKIEFLDTYNKTDLSPGSSYLSAGDLDFFDNINTRKFDLILNTHSFQEMDNSVVRSYFELIYQQANKNCLFFQSNWYQSKMSQLDGSFMDNNPEDYPYRGSDEIIFEGEDPFTHYLSSKLSYKPTRRSFTSIRYINLNTVA